MSEPIPTREEAFAILKEFNTSEGLIRHALAVEGVMRYVARKQGRDEDLWGVVGLIHDLDYERFPDEHCQRTEAILRERGWPETIIRAAVSHGWGICTDVEPLSDLEKTLYAVDEVTGLVAAAALVRPSRSVMDMKAKSVAKKFRDKAFAAGVNRDVVRRGAERLGVDLADLFTDVIMGMREVAADIGLAGSPLDHG